MASHILLKDGLKKIGQKKWGNAAISKVNFTGKPSHSLQQEQGQERER